MEFRIKVSDPKISEWLTHLQENDAQNFDARVETMLKIFYEFVQNSSWEYNSSTVEAHSQTIQADIQNKLEQALNTHTITFEERFARPINREFEQLKETIDEFRGMSRNAAQKGKIGELNIERQLQNYFPESEMLDTRHQAQQADFHFVVQDFVLLLEIKTYSNNVPSKEVEKFFRDLTSKPHIHAGIMVSATSGIANRPRFSYEIMASETGPKLAIFLPNSFPDSGGDASGLVWAILFALRVLQQQKTSNDSVGANGGNVEQLEELCELIQHQMKWLEHLLEYNQETLLKLEKSHRKATASLDDWMLQCKRIWKMNHDVLVDQIRVTKQFLMDGKKELIPLPSSLTKQNWQCCGKKYKTERNYLKHREQKH